MMKNPAFRLLPTNTPDYNPTEENGYIRRDYEYVRLGTLSLLAGIDLLTGEAIPFGEPDTQKVLIFIKFFKKCSLQNIQKVTRSD